MNYKKITKPLLLKGYMRHFFSLIFYISYNLVAAQPTIEWQKSLGGSDDDQARSIQQTTDGGFIVTGYTYLDFDSVNTYKGFGDFWVVKLSNNGLLEWQKTLGGSDLDWPYAIRQTRDTGFIVAGFTYSDDGDVSGHHGENDAWIVKLSNTGIIEWQKAIGGNNYDEAWSIDTTSNGGYIFVGTTDSNDGNVPATHDGSLDLWVVKLNSTGDIEWQKTLGGSEREKGNFIKQTSDGGYIIAGETKSNNGDVSGNNGNVDFWVIKLDSTGNLQWQKPLGGSGLDVGSNVYETSDGYIAFGYVGSDDGDVMGHQGLFDFWVVKLDNKGKMLWQKTLGGSNADWGYAGIILDNGHPLIIGTTRSTDGDTNGNDGSQDIWIVNLDHSGGIMWQKTLGGTKVENGFSVSETLDGSIILCGSSSSDDGDVTENHGGLDFWIVKLSPESVNTNEPFQETTLEIYPNPTRQSFTLNIPSKETIHYLRISDLTGREVFRQAVSNGADVDISSLQNGMYLVTATTSSGLVFSAKLVKDSRD